MPIALYPVCWRGFTDCEPIHCIDSAPPETTEEQLYEFDYTPESFVCTGCAQNPGIEQDRYRLCFKNEATDEISENDLQDLTSIIAVVGAALNLDAVRKVNRGVVEIPAAQGFEIKEHFTNQRPEEQYVNTHTTHRRDADDRR